MSDMDGKEIPPVMKSDPINYYLGGRKDDGKRRTADDLAIRTAQFPSYDSIAPPSSLFDRSVVHYVVRLLEECEREVEDALHRTEKEGTRLEYVAFAFDPIPLPYGYRRPQAPDMIERVWNATKARVGEILNEKGWGVAFGKCRKAKMMMWTKESLNEKGVAFESREKVTLYDGKMIKPPLPDSCFY